MDVQGGAASAVVHRPGQVSSAGRQEMVDVLDATAAGAGVRGRQLKSVEILAMETVSGQQLRQFKGRTDGRTEFADGRDGREEETSGGSGR